MDATTISCCFPPELEHLIFIQAAHLLKPGLAAIASLMLVAKRVQRWLEPFLWDTAMYVEWRTGPKFRYPPILAPGNLEPLALKAGLEETTNITNLRHTRHLLLHAQAPSSVSALLSDILSARLTHLALFVIKIELPELEHLVGTRFPNLTHLTVALDQLPFSCDPGPDDERGPPPEFRFNHEPFIHITHLDLVTIANGWDKGWSGLALLPALTHLAAHDPIPQSFFRGVFKHCKVLYVFVFLWSSYGDDSDNEGGGDTYWASYTATHIAQDIWSDVRFISMKSPSGCFRDWETGANGGDDFWKKADLRRMLRG